MSNGLKGTLLTVVAGIAWGLSGTSGQYLMAHGISSLVLTNLRLLIAGGILMVLAYATAKDRMLAFLKDRKSLLSLLIFCSDWPLPQSICLSNCYSGDQCRYRDSASVCLSCRDFDL